MNESQLENITSSNNSENQPLKGATVIKTDIDAKDGQNKCPKCGATDISLNINNGHLRCNYCRYEFKFEKVEELGTDINQLQGDIMGSGTQDIVADTKDVLTFKCESCGAEVVIDTSSSLQARCHWCRNTLSVNQQIPNGSIPDVVLPFVIKKDEARSQIEKFVGRRKFFAHPKFKQEFTTDNIMGVYFPYMVVDINSHVKLIGEGEHLVRSYTRSHNDNQQRYFDADVYSVEREFDLTINGLTIESSSDKLQKRSSSKTNNVINAIMPFDIENCVKYNANYLKGFTSERRDTNVEQLKTLVDVQSKDIARFSANKTLTQYDRGVAWSHEQFDVKGQRWKAAYLPVWLYSYQQVSGSKKVLHYVAVNARTKETMGSVPVHIPKLFFISFLVEILGFLAMLFIDFDNNWIFLFSGILYFIMIYAKYRNSDARHQYEVETKVETSNLGKKDTFLMKRKGLTNSKIIGVNNNKVNGKEENISNQLLNSVIEQNSVANFIKNSIDKKGGNL